MHCLHSLYGMYYPWIAYPNWATSVCIPPPQGSAKKPLTRHFITDILETEETGSKRKDGLNHDRHTINELNATRILTDNNDHVRDESDRISRKRQSQGSRLQENHQLVAIIASGNQKDGEEGDYRQKCPPRQQRPLGNESKHSIKDVAETQGTESPEDPHGCRNGYHFKSQSHGSFLRQQQHHQENQFSSTLKRKFGDVIGSGDEGDLAGNHEGEEGPCGGSVEKKKKARTTFTGRQIFELEKKFEVKKYLSATERSELASLLSVTETQVFIT